MLYQFIWQAMTLSKRIIILIMSLIFVTLPSCERTEVKQEEDIESNNGLYPEPEPEPEPEKGPEEFVILFTNDIHSQIEPLSKDETYNADRGGVKRIKALVDSVRKDGRITIE